MTIIAGFTGSPLDRADQMRTNEEAMARARQHPDARFLILSDLNPLASPDGQHLHWASRAEVPEGPTVFLGLDSQNVPHFAVDAHAPDLPVKPFDARKLAMVLATHGDAAILAQARSMLDWHRRHQFCAACGFRSRVAKAGYCRICQSCQAQHFPRVDPVVIMLAEYDDRVLVARQPHFPPTFFSALAGFVEPGESLEEAVARELHEEAGIRVHDVRYVASQPWPFPSSLMLGAFATALDDKLLLDMTELAEARWVSRQDVQAALAGSADWTVPQPTAIAYTLLRHWAESGC